MVLFYCKFGEKVSGLHMIGVFLMIACIVCISLEATSQEEEPELVDGAVEAEETEKDENDAYGLSPTAAGILSIGCGVLSACLMSTKHMFIRLYKSNYSGSDMGVDSSMLEFFIYTCFLIPLSQVEGFEMGSREILLGGLAGILICSGRIFISVGISVGLAGPA